jgi:glycosyltransferase involved in cell wall biosynthesis
MHIIHIVWGMGVGGTENMLVDIANKQTELNRISIVVVDNIYSRNVINRLHNDIEIYYINRKCGHRSFYSVLKLNYFLFKMAPNIIHCHTPSLKSMIYTHKILNAKLCVTCHDTHIDFNNYSAYDKVFSISEAVRNDLMLRYVQDSTIVTNGIDFEKIERKNLYNSKSNDSFLIVQVSRLDHDKKGQDVMIKALNHIVYVLGRKRIKYIVIGDGPSKDYLINYAERMNVAEYCDFLGSLDRNTIYATLKDYDLLIQPSYYEGFGLTVVEGMAANLPVLVSDIDGPMDIVKSGKYGFVFECGNHLELAGTIDKIIDTHCHSHFREWLLENFEHILHNYDINDTAFSYLENYRILISKKTEFI